MTYSDNFNRANETPLASPWVVRNGTHWALASNRVSHIADTGGTDEHAVITGLDANAYVRIKVDDRGNAHGVSFRSSGTNDYWRVVASGDGDGGIYIQKFVSGTKATMGSWFPNWTNGDTIGASFVGSTLRVIHNGLEIGRITDAFNSSATDHGLAGGGNTMTGLLDNFDSLPPLPDAGWSVGQVRIA